MLAAARPPLHWPRSLLRALGLPRACAAALATAAAPLRSPGDAAAAGLRLIEVAPYAADGSAPTPEDEVAASVSEEAVANPELQKCVRVAVVGAPNAGKSTLTNALVGRLVTAVSRKTNTTRSEALGALTRGDTQLLLYDTPGVVGPESWHGDAHGARVTSAWRAAAAADVIMFIVDAHRQVTVPDPRVPLLLSRAAASLAAVAPRRGDSAAALMAQFGSPDAASAAAAPPPPPPPFPPPSVLVLNKTDLLPAATRQRQLASLLRQLSPLHAFDAAFGVSALHKDGTAPLLQDLLGRSRPGRWPLRPERATDAGPAAQALTATREALFERLHAELPYAIALRHVSWEDFRDGSVRIEQVLLVPTDAQRRIVVGRGGAAIGQLGIAARKSLEKLFGRRVHLILRVKVARGSRAAREAGDDAVAADAQAALRDFQPILRAGGGEGEDDASDSDSDEDEEEEDEEEAPRRRAPRRRG